MDLSKIYPQRPDWVHKGAYGSVLCICGSKFYSGSATLAAVSALRAGADLVTVISPQRAADVASHTLCDLITYPLKGDFLSSRHLKDILEIATIRKITSVVLGCGLGRHESTVLAVYKLISAFNIPLVLDADALFAISKSPQTVFGKQVVLTPHAGELAILLRQEKIGETIEEKLICAKKAATTYRAVVLFKGHVDIITDGESTITNSSGTPFMTKGGFGDTLAGILGALLSRAVGLFEAAHVAAYINGRAGELASQKYGEGVVASDIFEMIPKVINQTGGSG